MLSPQFGRVLFQIAVSVSPLHAFCVLQGGQQNYLLSSLIIQQQGSAYQPHISAGISEPQQLSVLAIEAFGSTLQSVQLDICSPFPKTIWMPRSKNHMTTVIHCEGCSEDNHLKLLRYMSQVAIQINLVPQGI